MMKYIPLIFFVLVAFTSCDTSIKEENARLRKENDSLRNELQGRLKIASILQDIGIYIDSIDVRRKKLGYMLTNEGVTPEDYKIRMAGINEYVKMSEKRMADLDDNLKTTLQDTAAYFMVLDALKSELEVRLNEIYSLEIKVEKIQNQNSKYANTLQLMDSELSSAETELEKKKQELNLYGNRIDQLIATFKVSEADAYYSRAQAVEEAARRTKLAPVKKRETYREALELYKKSLSLGKEEAQEKIKELERKI